MPSHQIDLDAGQVVRWAIAEQKADPTSLRLSARMSTETLDIPMRQQLHLGDEEREDLSEVVTVATLEIAPAHTNAGWLLTVTVEDEAGPHLTAGASGQPIDAGTFCKHFIRPDRGTATVTAETSDAAAWDRLRQLPRDIETDRHPAQGPQGGRNLKISGRQRNDGP